MSLLNIIPLAIFGLCILAALGISFSWVWARLYCKPKRRAPAKMPSDYNLPFEAVSLYSHNAPLHGWFIPITSGSFRHPTIILAHGWSNNSNQMLPVARMLNGAGFAVFLYDARGHGASGEDGPITIAKFVEDIRAAVDYVWSRSDVDTRRVGLIGHSMGGSAAILAASDDPRIRVVVSSSAFADPLALTWGFLRAMHIPRVPFLWLVSHFIERWLCNTMSDMAPQNRIGRIQAPMLLIHGGSDQYIPPANMETLYARAHPEKAEHWLIPGRGHSDIIRDSRYGSRIIEFLNAHLSQDHTATPSNEPAFQIFSTNAPATATLLKNPSLSRG